MVAFPFRDIEEALAEVNASRFGLQAGIFTNDLAHAWRAFEALDVGGVILNDVPTYRVDHMPYGGVKESGIGREGLRWARPANQTVRPGVVGRTNRPREPRSCAALCVSGHSVTVGGGVA